MPCMWNSVFIRKIHTPACRARFDALIRADRVGRTPRTPAALTPAPEASLLKPCLMLIHPNCHLVHVSHQAIQKPQCQPKQTRNLMKSFFKQMQMEETIEECINHQVLIPSLNMHVMKTQQLVKFVMKSVLMASGYISRNVINLQDEGQISQLITQADDAWVSLPCTDFTPWQHMNAHRHGWGFQQKLEKRRSRLGKCSLKQRGL